ncbi:uncharacterized protein SPSK_02871 [Sporothrix schenckii 1099-18]|uniref:Uncharacterized protein n=1 Tax=Sporothrix schenckii 1099-18 TaxID=1397361 RepID=A0A0F2MAK5_SPOSC|nr:uncharacterized protein SPSK_02871 [Sporothrix schenckii 1099-18]KJR86728.1 hypothetical protein SPSK_02871 [Sporothrix schenckii 1099-18]
MQDVVVEMPRGEIELQTVGATKEKGKKGHGATQGQYNLAPETGRLLVQSGTGKAVVKADEVEEADKSSDSCRFRILYRVLWSSGLKIR